MGSVVAALDGGDDDGSGGGWLVALGGVAENGSKLRTTQAYDASTSRSLWSLAR